MTTIRFNYTDSYNNPSRGSLAFMPHRRHAANETEILPKPFTIPLLNGEVTVNLQPNSSSWVWIVTEYFEGVSKSFYTTIPDRDGVMEHTELVHISPSSLPAPYDAVEPVWWAEMRQYKNTVSDTLLQSGEALTEARAAIETGRESIERTQHNASVAGAYADESRQHSYDAREYRDEAEQWRNEAQEQADRAATGPESAAARAEAAATRSETARDRAVTAEDESRTSAAQARGAETNAGNSAGQAQTAASTAQSEANRARIEADRAQGYADDLLAGPSDDADRAENAANLAESYRDQTQSYSNTAQEAVDTVQDRLEDAQAAAANAQDSAELSESYLNQYNSRFGEWADVELHNNWIANGAASTYTIQVRKTPLGTQMKGRVWSGELTDPNDRIVGKILHSEHRPVAVLGGVHVLASDNQGPVKLHVSGSSGIITIASQNTIPEYLHFTGIIFPVE